MKKGVAQFYFVDELIVKLETLKQTNRDRLSIEDLNILEDCLSILRDFDDEDDDDTNTGVILRVTSLLWRFLTETDILDQI